MDPDSFKLRGSRNLESPNYYGYTTQTFCIPVLLTEVYVPLFRILIGPFAALWGTWGAKSGAAFIPALSVGPSYVQFGPKREREGREGVPILSAAIIDTNRLYCTSVEFGHILRTVFSLHIGTRTKTDIILGKKNSYIMF